MSFSSDYGFSFRRIGPLDHWTGIGLDWTGLDWTLDWIGPLEGKRQEWGEDVAKTPKNCTKFAPLNLWYLASQNSHSASKTAI